jgi:hypothetical protein
VSAHIITAFFESRSDADGAMAQLAASGVSAHEISVLPKHLARRDDIALAPVTKAPEGAVLGAIVGGVVGALVAAVVGGGSLIVPGLDLVVAGRAVAALAGAGALGALGMAAGAVVGAMRPEFEAKYLGDALAGGGALIAVRCHPERLERLEELLHSSGGARVRTSRAH